MADLNIKPDPAVIVLQFGFFMATLYSVKKLILEPYLSMREQRQIATAGKQGDAKELIKENKALSVEVEQKWDAASESIRQEISQLRKKALDNRTKLVAEAETQARQTVSEMQASLRQNLQQEKEKLPAIIKQLAGEWYAETLH